jgi:hypothetical protein
MKSLILALLAVVLLSVFTAGPSNAGTGGHGGVDVVYPDGSSQPVEAFIEENSQAVLSACGLVKQAEPGEDAPDPRVWRESLDRVISTLHQKLPAAAISLADALSKTRFIFIALPDGITLNYTADDGSFVTGAKFNSALRIGPKVYISLGAWRQYWTHSERGHRYTDMLVRVIHEAWLTDYHSPDKLLLGEAVVEVLRLAGFYEGPGELVGAKGSEIARYLLEHRLVPGERVVQDDAEELGRYDSQYRLKVSLWGRLLAQATLKRGTYESDRFQEFKKNAESFVSKMKRVPGGEWSQEEGMFAFYEADELSRLRAYLASSDPGVLYRTIELPASKGFWGGTLIEKRALSGRVLRLKSLLRQPPQACSESAVHLK